MFTNLNRAELVQMKKHESLDDPPDYPFFKGRKREHKPVDLPEASTSLSPGRKVHIRTECIEPLQRIGQLYEKGTLTNEQYKTLQEVIMKDMQLL